MERDIEAEFGTVKEDLTKLKSDLTSIKDSVQAMATEKVRAKFNDAQQKFDQWTETARYRSRAGLENFAAEVEDRPLTSILVAFGIGVVLGRILDR